MRLVARIPDQRQVNGLIDSLKNIGLDRGDMVVSDLANQKASQSVEAATDAGVVVMHGERNEAGELKPFADGVKGLQGDEGILVAVKVPKHSANRVREMMEQQGAVEIVQD